MKHKLVKIYTFERSPIFKAASLIGLYIIPLLAGAQAPNPKELSDRILDVQGTLDVIIGVFFVLATVIFLWGVIQYIRSSADDAGRKKAQGIMTWGIIGLAVMTVAWGIVNILEGYLGVPDTAPDRIAPPIF